MDWFNEKTSIADIQIPNWVIILCGAVIVILLISESLTGGAVGR